MAIKKQIPEKYSERFANKENELVVLPTDKPSTKQTLNLTRNQLLCSVCYWLCF